MRASQARAADVIRDHRVYADVDRLQRLPMSSPAAQASRQLDATKTTWPLILSRLVEIPEDQAGVIGALAIVVPHAGRSVARPPGLQPVVRRLLGALQHRRCHPGGDLLIAGAGQTAEPDLARTFEHSSAA